MTTGGGVESTQGLAPLARGSGLNVAGMLVTQVAGVGIVMILARSSGEDAVGIYSQSFALRAILLLVCALGARVSMTHFVAAYRADGDPGGVRGVATLGLTVTGLVSVLSALGLALSADWLARDVFDDADLTDPIRLAALSLPFFLVMTVALAATQGFQTMRAFAGVGLIFEPAARFVLTALLVAVGFGVGGAMWALVIASMAGAALAMRALGRFVAHMGSAPAVYRPGELARFSAYSWVASIATQGLLWADIVILGAYVSSADVGVYQVATRVVLLGTMVTPALTASLAPRVADAWRRGEREFLQLQYRALTGWTFRLSLPILVTIIVFPEPILRLFGGGFDEGRVVIWWLVGGALVETLSAPSAVTLNQTGHNRVNMVINIGALASNLALNVILIPIFGISGAAVAWALSLVVPGAARVIAVRNLVTGIWPWDRDQLRAVVAAVVAGATAFAVAKLMTWPWLAELIVGACTVLAVYVGLLALVGPAQVDIEALRALTVRARSGERRTAPGAARSTPRTEVSGDRRRPLGRRHTGSA